MLTLLLGGARSGKSSLAVEMGIRSQRPVLFVATAEAFDDDLRTRIEHHRRDRPDWPTVEEPLDLAGVLSRADETSTVIVDCLTVWLANLLHHMPDPDRRRSQLAAFVDAAGARTGADTIVVSNEVGLGIHPDTPLGREYRDELGRLNQQIAARADRTILLVAGRALPLADPWSIL